MNSLPDTHNMTFSPSYTLTSVPQGMLGDDVSQEMEISKISV